MEMGKVGNNCYRELYDRGGSLPDQKVCSIVAENGAVIVEINRIRFTIFGPRYNIDKALKELNLPHESNKI